MYVILYGYKYQLERPVPCCCVYSIIPPTNIHYTPLEVIQQFLSQGSETNGKVCTIAQNIPVPSYDAEEGVLNRYASICIRLWNTEETLSEEMIEYYTLQNQKNIAWMKEKQMNLDYIMLLEQALLEDGMTRHLSNLV